MDKKKHLGGTFNINYHIVFCPKRRASVLVGNIAHDCEATLVQLVEELRGQIQAIEIMPDHVHIFISIHPKISPHQIVKKLKGATSRLLRKKYPQLLRLPCLWSSSYYIGTVGHVSDSIVKLYIEHQKSR